jgi:hypothetical protein
LGRAAINTTAIKRLAGYPEKCRQAEYGQHPFLGRTHAAYPREMHRLGKRDTPGQPQAGDRHHQDDYRKAPGHPFREARSGAELIEVNLHEYQVWRRSDWRAQAADAGGVGDTQQQGNVHAAVSLF